MAYRRQNIRSGMFGASYPSNTRVPRVPERNFVTKEPEMVTDSAEIVNEEGEIEAQGVVVDPATGTVLPPGTRIYIETPSSRIASSGGGDIVATGPGPAPAPDTTVDMETPGEVTTMETIPVTDIELGLAPAEPKKRWSWTAFLAGIAGGAAVGGFFGWYFGGDDKEEK